MIVVLYDNPATLIEGTHRSTNHVRYSTLPKIIPYYLFFRHSYLLGLRPWQYDALKKTYGEANFRKTRQKLNQLVDEDVWPNELKGTAVFYAYGCSHLKSWCLICLFCIFTCLIHFAVFSPRTFIMYFRLRLKVTLCQLVSHHIYIP